MTVTSKYLLMFTDYANKAGKLKQSIETQKRLLQTIMKSKQPDNVNQLLLASAETYDVADEFLEWTLVLLKDVAHDYRQLSNAAMNRSHERMIEDLKNMNYFLNTAKNEFKRPDSVPVN